MPPAALQPDGVDTILNNYIAAARTNREEAMRAWSRNCDLYARYFAGLGNVHGPEELFAAHADFLIATAEEITHGITGGRLSGRRPASSAGAKS
jgi:hypothetical protein